MVTEETEGRTKADAENVDGGEVVRQLDPKGRAGGRTKGKSCQMFVFNFSCVNNPDGLECNSRFPPKPQELPCIKRFVTSSAGSWKAKRMYRLLPRMTAAELPSGGPSVVAGAAEDVAEVLTEVSHSRRSIRLDELTSFRSQRRTCPSRNVSAVYPF
jgi:hypothetical protein